MNKIEDRIESQKSRVKNTLTYKVYDLHVDLTENFLEQLHALKLTQKQLAERAGLKPSYVNRVLNNPSNLTIETVVKLAEALEMDVKMLLKKKTENSWFKFSGEVYTGFKKILESAVDEVIESKLKILKEQLHWELTYENRKIDSDELEPEPLADDEFPFAA